METNTMPAATGTQNGNTKSISILKLHNSSAFGKCQSR